MDVSQYYAISLGGALLLFIFRHELRIYAPNITYYISFYIINPLVIQRRHWSSITRAQAIFLLIYAILNGVFMGVKVETSKDLMLRSGIMAIINIFPLFLGGRTSSLADQLMGLSLHSYYIAHHWIGRIAVMQGLLHATLALTSSNVFNMRAVSGIVAASSLALLLLSSLYMFRIFIETFLWLHLLFVMIGIGSLLWHLIPGALMEITILVFALAVWIGNMLWQWRRRFHIANAASWIYSSDTGVTALKLTLMLKQPISILPGQYFYLRYRFRSHPSVVTWWNVASSIKDSKATPTAVANDTTTSLQIKPTSLTFLIPPQGRSSLWSNLATNIDPDALILDGPYGQDLHLERYDTVILAAQGIGIAGVLPYVRYLADWKYHNDISRRRKIITRKLDLYWLLEDNSEQSWIGEYLAELQVRDEAQALLQIWCYYPQKKGSKPFIEITDSFKCIYPNSIGRIAVPTAIRETTRRTPGTSIVVACGRASFTKCIRHDVRCITSTDCVVEFEEAEYRPLDSKASSYDHKTWPHNNERSQYLIEDRKETMLKDLRLVRSPKQAVIQGKSKVKYHPNREQNLGSNSDIVQYPSKVYQMESEAHFDEESVENYVQINTQSFV